MNNNVYQLINYQRIINDNDDFFLWMKLANDNNNFICFNNQDTRMEWFDLIKEEIEKYGEKEEELLHSLRFFEKLHWISIESEEELIFQIRLSESKHPDEIQFLLIILSEKAKVTQNNGKYYLESKS